jgi:hypothetical protein
MELRQQSLPFRGKEFSELEFSEYVIVDLRSWSPGLVRVGFVDRVALGQIFLPE